MRVSAIFRIALAMVGIVVSIVLAAFSLGFIPDAQQERTAARKSVCENVAVQCCLAAQRHDTTMMLAVIQAFQARNPDVSAVGLRTKDGRLIAEAGNHNAVWQMKAGDVESRAEVPIFSGKRPWGNLEVVFVEPVRGSWAEFSPQLKVIAFVGSAVFLIFVVYLRRMLQYLDPSAVVPDRVRQALDTLAEGVVIVDPDERIVLANRAFAKNVGAEPGSLQGRRVKNLGIKAAIADEEGPLPWSASLNDGATQRGVLMTMSTGGAARTFAVNSAPIVDADGKSRGALATFDDITEVEQKNKKLHEMLDVVQKSGEEIRRQNELLTKMATCDALTGCFNRRYLFSHLEKLWASFDRATASLGCIMLDIDHFKSVNDTHGHAKGDAVLQEVAARLQANIEPTTILCRYGGEEFCVILPDASIEQTAAVAERLRLAICSSPIAELKVSSSFGATSTTCGAHDPAEMLEQADKSLYFSKRNGRNRVTKFVDLPADFSVAEKTPKSPQAPVPQSEIPFHAVTALLSALSFRDSRTADHSRRVADLCVAIGGKFMSQRECYILEVAALLHDVGKVGVPDAILLKPGPLTKEEWEVMQVHDRIGIEILNAAFSCDRLTEIVRTHHAFYGGSGRDPDLPQGEQIRIEARILTVADAYDAIVSDRVYRKGRTRDEAMTELRRCAGLQFDPQVVAKLDEVLRERPDLGRHDTAGLSKSAALQIGLHIERLAEAVDARDVKQLSAVADRLATTASYVGSDAISQAAKEVAVFANAEPELADVVQRTSELLELCRSTQSAFLQNEDLAVR